MKEGLLLGEDIYRTGIDPRPEFLNEKVRKSFSEDLSEHTVYWDPEFSDSKTSIGLFGEFPDHALRAAQAKLCGIEPQNPKLFQENDYSLLRFYNEYGIPDPNSNHMPEAQERLIKAAAAGKILGAFIDYDSGTMQSLQKSVNLIQEQEMRKIWAAREWWWNILPYAKILNLDVHIEEKDAATISDVLEFSQMRTMNEFSSPHDPSFSTIHLWWYGSLAACIAQARILGIDVPIYKEIVDGIKETARRQNIEGGNVEDYFVETISNLAIISAKEIKVGGEKGLELYF